MIKQTGGTYIHSCMVINDIVLSYLKKSGVYLTRMNWSGSSTQKSSSPEDQHYIYIIIYLLTYDELNDE